MIKQNYLFQDLEALDRHLNPKRTQDTFGAPPEWETIAYSGLLSRIENVSGEKYLRFGKFYTQAGDSKACVELYGNLTRKWLPKLIDWNGRGYDRPVLEWNAIEHGIDLSHLHKSGTKWENYKQRYSQTYQCDLMDVTSDYRASRPVSLDLASALVGLPGKTFASGDQVKSMFEAGEIELIAAYCECDVALLAGTYLRWGLTVGEFNLEGFITSAESFQKFIQSESKSKLHFEQFYDEVDWPKFLLNHHLQQPVFPNHKEKNTSHEVHYG